MQIQINTDNHIQGGDQLSREIEDTIENKLAEFRDRVTRVQVFLADENSRKKGGAHDIRCTLEARLAGLQPISVTDESGSLRQALDGAADKLEKTLRRTLGKRDDHKGRTSFAGDQPT
jgi:ribosomal subunit interface protein